MQAVDGGAAVRRRDLWPDARIGTRPALPAGLLEQLTDAQLTDLFAGARFDKPRSALKEMSPVPEWVRVFKTRVRAISEGPPCPDA